MIKAILSAALLLSALPAFAQTKPLTPPDVLGAAKVVAGLHNPRTLLASGTVAPDFTVQDKDGKAVKLSDYRGKTVILDFWATWCGTCSVALYHSAKITQKYADKNVVVLAVNVLDTQSAFQTWMSKPGNSPHIHFAVDPGMIHVAALYHVSSLPTQYLIGNSGKIITGFVGSGLNDNRMEDALKATATGN